MPPSMVHRKPQALNFTVKTLTQKQPCRPRQHKANSGNATQPVNKYFCASQHLVHPPDSLAGTHTCMHAHARTHTYTHARTRARARKHTRTNSHAHTKLHSTGKSINMPVVTVSS
eukprot:TRINITY_DN28397_c0_g1_i1.p2 TRINITY_DN28397_c0_g1~~TRINITY_DN28397_c0_g1_i1.p2  ORF type:complete len:132 (+),score=7.22 TRINITY_DN28397_c0_g1_i1:53-397(+)